MSEKKNVPKLRFPEFTEPWEQRKLGDVFTERTERANGDEELLSVTIGNGVIRQIDSDKRNIASEDKSNYKIVHKGDVPYNSMRMWQGAVGNSEYDGIVSPAYTVLVPSKEANGKFFMELFKKESTLKIFQRWSQGLTSDTWNLKYPVLSTIEISIPRIEEQKRIAECFQQVDTLITLHQRKLDHVKDLKKSMLQKMFPKNGQLYPEVRFPEFTDAWEQRKLGEIATFINGRAYSQPELLSSGKYKVLRVGNFYTNDSWYYSDLELGDKYYADYGDLLYTWSATFGPHIWLGDKVIYHYHIWKIDLSNQLEKQFAVQLLEQDKANILSSKNGSTMVHVTKERMEQKDVIIPPSIKEQQKIGAFFIRLDHLITLHQRELDHLKLLKKGMLQQMFV